MILTTIYSITLILEMTLIMYEYMPIHKLNTSKQLNKSYYLNFIYKIESNQVRTKLFIYVYLRKIILILINIYWFSKFIKLILYFSRIKKSIGLYVVIN